MRLVAHGSYAALPSSFETVWKGVANATFDNDCVLVIALWVVAVQLTPVYKAAMKSHDNNFQHNGYTQLIVNIVALFCIITLYIIMYDKCPLSIVFGYDNVFCEM